MARRMDAEVLDHGTNLKSIDVKAVGKVVEKLMTKRTDVAAKNQEAGGLIKLAEQEHGANRKALGLVCQLKKLSPEHVADFWRTLKPLADHMGVGPSVDLVDLIESA